jgi:dTDP-4-dehydrorhamnose reductase
MDSLLVLGGGGKLGRALMAAFQPGCRVETRSRATGLEATDFAQVRALLEEFQPSLVANAVALGGLDACETDPALAWQLNAELPGILARCARELGFRLLHFSTDAVFDGRRETGAYAETDAPAPLNAYGRSKLDGDLRVAAENPEAWVFRLSVLAGGGQGQFLERMLDRARAGLPLQVAEDIVCSPSSAADVAAAVRAAVAEGLPGGLYHTVNAGSASLWELVAFALTETGLSVPVEPVPHDCFPSLAARPLRTPLVSVRRPPLRPWREAIREHCRGLRRIWNPGPEGNTVGPLGT